MPVFFFYLPLFVFDAVLASYEANARLWEAKMSRQEQPTIILMQ
jgi:hypothetical protein